MKSDRISLVWGVFHFASGLTFLKTRRKQCCQVERVWKQAAAHESLKLCTTPDNASSADNWNNTFPKLVALSNYWYCSGNHIIFFLPCSLSAVSHFTYQMAPRKAAVTVVWETTSRWVVEPWSHTLSLWFRRRTNSTTRLHQTRGLKLMATPIPTRVSHRQCSVYLSCFSNLKKVIFFFIPLSSAMVEMFLSMCMNIWSCQLIMIVRK